MSRPGVYIGSRTDVNNQQPVGVGGANYMTRMKHDRNMETMTESVCEPKFKRTLVIHIKNTFKKAGSGADKFGSGSIDGNSN